MPSPDGAHLRCGDAVLTCEVRSQRITSRVLRPTNENLFRALCRQGLTPRPRLDAKFAACALLGADRPAEAPGGLPQREREERRQGRQVQHHGLAVGERVLPMLRPRGDDAPPRLRVVLRSLRFRLARTRALRRCQRAPCRLRPPRCGRAISSAGRTGGARWAARTHRDFADKRWLLRGAPTSGARCASGPKPGLVPMSDKVFEDLVGQCPCPTRSSTRALNRD